MKIYPGIATFVATSVLSAASFILGVQSGSLKIQQQEVVIKADRAEVEELKRWNNTLESNLKETREYLDKAVELAERCVNIHRRKPVAMYGYSTEHGFSTEYVEATRYENPSIGYNVGFVFPKNCDNYDRPEVFEWFESHGGYVYQGGGAPCAPMYVIFDDVKDRESADQKLRKIMPQLDKFMRRLK
jgi:hypothetical protein